MDRGCNHQRFNRQKTVIKVIKKLAILALFNAMIFVYFVDFVVID
jgi:hypothetical protein